MSNKRIAIVVAAQNFVLRGVGLFCKSIIDLGAEQGWFVDIIMDQSPRKNPLTEYCVNNQFYFPKEPLKYTTTNELSTFKQIFSHERSLNFRAGLIEAFKNHTYDVIITNTAEATLATYALDIHRDTKVLLYTHHESEAGFARPNSDIYTKSTFEIFKNCLNLDGIYIGTQSINNFYRIGTKNIKKLLPIRIPELKLLDYKYDLNNKKGVGFIGPWEPRKNPRAFIELLKNTKLPGVVITTKKSAEKFRIACAEHNLECDIYHDVLDEEKIKIIKSLKIAFHPSISETFGLGVLETAHTCPTILLNDHDWTEVHKNYTYILSNDSDLANKVIKIYNHEDEYSLDSFINLQKALKVYHADATDAWINFVNHEEPKVNRKNGLLTELEKRDIKIKDWFNEMTGSLCVDEFTKTMACNKVNDVYIFHTKDATWISKNKDFKVIETVVDKLFDNI